MFSKKRLKAFFSRKERFPEKLEEAKGQASSLCFPDIESLSSEAVLDEDFFDAHILEERRDEGWLKSSNPSIPLIVEYGDSAIGNERPSSAGAQSGEGRSYLKLLSGPEYQPSFVKGLHTCEILASSYGVNDSFNQYNMYVLDKPLLPRYSSLSASHKSSSSSLASRSLAAPSTASTGLSTPPPPSSGLSAQQQRRKRLTKQKRVESVERLKRGNPRQVSADSGYDSPRVPSIHSHFELPPRVTNYMESECYLANLPRCDQFIAHLGRTLKPLISDLNFTRERARDEINNFARILHRLAQESVISFPRSSKIVNTSPRFQEFLRISVENVVVRLVHEKVFPVICYLSKREDKELSSCLGFLRASGLTADQLGLPEDFCIPLSAAIVELAALDMKTTPLDRMTCMYDSIEQIGNHIRHAVQEARGEDETGSVLRLDDLPYPNDAELVILLSTVILQSRPRHLMATLNYADVFAWSVPADMIECVKLMQSAVDLLRNLQPDKLPPASGKLKRDVSMEEIIQLADEFQQSFDRQGNRLEPVKSALDMHREKFTLRLELSAEEKNRRQEEAWALLDRCRSPLNDSGKFKRGFLARIHDKLICSTDSVEIVDE